jgi:hypothetical protein
MRELRRQLAEIGAKGGAQVRIGGVHGNIYGPGAVSYANGRCRLIFAAQLKQDFTGCIWPGRFRENGLGFVQRCDCAEVNRRMRLR